MKWMNGEIVTEERNRVQLFELQYPSVRPLQARACRLKNKINNKTNIILLFISSKYNQSQESVRAKYIGTW